VKADPREESQIPVGRAGRGPPLEVGLQAVQSRFAAGIPLEARASANIRAAHDERRRGRDALGSCTLRSARSDLPLAANSAILSDANPP
jgi:hypothetical protein